MDQEEIKGEERSADEAGKHGNTVVLDMDKWVKHMEAKLAFKSKNCKPSHPFTICRVPRDIRSVDNVAHDPLIVSIGPYHRGNPSLHEMEEVKWRNLNEIHDRDGNKFKDYLKVMKEIEPEARACYAGNINMEADEFIEMMLLDGLFIIELLWKRAFHFFLLQNFNIDDEEPIYTISGMLCRVGHDMLLLENQLPFFVLERLWGLTYECSRFNLRWSAYFFIRAYALSFKHHSDLTLLQEVFDEKEQKTKKKENPEMINEDGVHHLLHLAYLFLKPTSLTGTKKSKPTSGSSSESMEPTTGSISGSIEPTTGSSSESMEPIAKLPAFIKKMKTLSFLPPRCRDCFRSPSGQESQSMECTTAKLLAVIKNMRIPPLVFPCKSKDEPPKVIPSVVELNEAGVEFKCVKSKSFLDVKFEQGKMKMPCLSVQDSTKSLLRNFIAYEQCFPKLGSHFTSYCCFMDQLVNTPRDVEILKKSKIIENWLGSDEEVALLFNDLCKGIFLLPHDSSNYLAIPSKDVRKYSKKTWPKWRAKLKHDYFSNPWAIISLIAATYVIFLTSVQTYYAAFT